MPKNNRFERAVITEATLHDCEVIFPFDVNFMDEYKEKIDNNI
jgi:hypothetical protein